MNYKHNAQHSSPTQRASELKSLSEDFSDHLRSLKPGTYLDEFRCHRAAEELQSMEPRQESNPLPGFGLVTRPEDDPRFRGAIWRCETHVDHARLFEFRRQRILISSAGDGQRIFGNPDRIPFSAELLHELFSMEPELIEGLDLRDVRDWWDSLEYEIILWMMAGFRGNGENYMALTETQDGISSTDNASALSKDNALPAIYRKIAAHHPFTKPTMLMNGWTRPGTNLGMDHNYAAVAKWSGDMSIEWLRLFSAWLGSSGIRPAILNIKHGDSDEHPRQYKKGCFVMLVSPRIAQQIESAPSYRKHQEELNNMPVDRRFKNQFLCKLGNLLVAESGRMPRFAAGPNQFCRALVFGARSMACGYLYNKEHKSLGRDGPKKPSVFDCRANTRLFGCGASHAARVLSATDPETGRVVDLGRIAVDIMEHSTASHN